MPETPYMHMTDDERTEWLTRLFEFELCDECGQDTDGHVVGPDPLGLPHAYCRPVSDATARTLAASYHPGMLSHLYSLASTGAIDRLYPETEAGETAEAISSDLEEMPGEHAPFLLALLHYVEHHGQRDPVPGWHRLWDDDIEAMLPEG